MGSSPNPCVFMTSVPESNRDTARNYGRLWGEFTTWVASSVYMNISDKSLAAYLHSQRVEGSSLAHCREILAAVRYRTGHIHWPSTTKILERWGTEERKAAA